MAFIKRMRRGRAAAADAPFFEEASPPLPRSRPVFTPAEEAQSLARWQRAHRRLAAPAAPTGSELTTLGGLAAALLGLGAIERSMQSGEASSPASGPQAAGLETAALSASAALVHEPPDRIWWLLPNHRPEPLPDSRADVLALTPGPLPTGSGGLPLAAMEPPAQSTATVQATQIGVSAAGAEPVRVSDSPAIDLAARTVPGVATSEVEVAQAPREARTEARVEARTPSPADAQPTPSEPGASAAAGPAAEPVAPAAMQAPRAIPAHIEAVAPPPATFDLAHTDAGQPEAATPEPAIQLAEAAPPEVETFWSATDETAAAAADPDVPEPVRLADAVRPSDVPPRGVGESTSPAEPADATPPSRDPAAEDGWSDHSPRIAEAVPTGPDATKDEAKPGGKANGHDTDADVTTPVHVAEVVTPPQVFAAPPVTMPAEALGAGDPPGAIAEAPGPAGQADPPAGGTVPSLPAQGAKAVPPAADPPAILIPDDPAFPSLPPPPALAEAPPAEASGDPRDSVVPPHTAQLAKTLPPAAILRKGDDLPPPFSVPAPVAEALPPGDDPSAIQTPGADALLAFPALGPRAVPDEAALLAWQHGRAAEGIGVDLPVTPPELPFQVALAPLPDQDAIL